MPNNSTYFKLLPPANSEGLQRTILGPRLEYWLSMQLFDKTFVLLLLATALATPAAKSGNAQVTARSDKQNDAIGIWSKDDVEDPPKAVNPSLCGSSVGGIPIFCKFRRAFVAAAFALSDSEESSVRSMKIKRSLAEESATQLSASFSAISTESRATTTSQTSTNTASNVMSSTHTDVVTSASSSSVTVITTVGSISALTSATDGNVTTLTTLETLTASVTKHISAVKADATAEESAMPIVDINSASDADYYDSLNEAATRANTHTAYLQDTLDRAVAMMSEIERAGMADEPDQIDLNHDAVLDSHGNHIFEKQLLDANYGILPKYLKDLTNHLIEYSRAITKQSNETLLAMAQMQGILASIVQTHNDDEEAVLMPELEESHNELSRSATEKHRCKFTAKLALAQETPPESIELFLKEVMQGAVESAAERCKLAQRTTEAEEKLIDASREVKERLKEVVHGLAMGMF